MRIACVDDEIAVLVHVLENSIAIVGPLSRAEMSEFTEEFVAVFDDSIAVLVPDEEAIVASDPARTFCVAGLIVVKVNTLLAADSLNTIAVQIDHQWAD